MNYDINNRWYEYYKELINEEFLNVDIESIPPVKGPIKNIEPGKVKAAISNTKPAKLSAVTKYQWKCGKGLAKLE